VDSALHLAGRGRRGDVEGQGEGVSGFEMQGLDVLPLPGHLGRNPLDNCHHVIHYLLLCLSREPRQPRTVLHAPPPMYK